MKNRRSYTTLSKLDAIQALKDNPEKSIRQVAILIGVPLGCLLAWKNRYEIGGEKALESKRSREVRVPETLKVHSPR